MTIRKHTVITGTGRSGTTFLVELLTNLGLDTGFTRENLIEKKNAIARAGLELDVRNKNCPYFVKSPWFCDYAQEVISREDIQIDHIFVPIRDLRAAAESRRVVLESNTKAMSLGQRFKFFLKPYGFNGGLWYTRSGRPGKQESILQDQLYKLLLAVAETGVPVTLMKYPKLVKNDNYCYEKLKPVLGEISRISFLKAFNETVQSDLVNSYNKNDI